MGEELARQAPCVADMVMPVPESGVPAAQGYARESGIPYGDGFVKNRYVGRTFIQPSQKQRGSGVRAEAQPAAREPQGQAPRRRRGLDRARHDDAPDHRVLREAGATEVHFRVSSPPYRWPCFYGLDTGKRSELLAADMSVGEISDYLGVDSLAYLDLDRLVAATGVAADVVLHRVLHRRVPGPGPAIHDTKLVLEVEARPDARRDRSASDASRAP